MHADNRNLPAASVDVVEITEAAMDAPDNLVPHHRYILNGARWLVLKKRVLSSNPSRMRGEQRVDEPVFDYFRSRNCLVAETYMYSGSQCVETIICALFAMSWCWCIVYLSTYAFVIFAKYRMTPHLVAITSPPSCSRPRPENLLQKFPTEKYKK